MSLRRVEQELRTLIRKSDRPDLEAALDHVGYTDDGGTLYVHIFAREDWPKVPPGDAFVLAHADHADLETLTGMRALHEEARLYLYDEFGKILRWFEGR